MNDLTNSVDAPKIKSFKLNSHMITDILLKEKVSYFEGILTVKGDGYRISYRTSDIVWIQHNT